jgi:hypothetical protein
MPARPKLTVVPTPEPEPEKPAPIQIPKTLGAVVDLFFLTQQKRLAAQKAVDKIEEQEKFLAQYLIDNVSREDSSGVSGKIAKVKINKRDVPTVRDWDAFYKYVLKTKDFSLLQKRVGEGAVKERWDNGKEVPGVEPFTVVKASVSKL